MNIFRKFSIFYRKEQNILDPHASQCLTHSCIDTCESGLVGWRSSIILLACVSRRGLLRWLSLSASSPSVADVEIVRLTSSHARRSRCVARLSPQM